MSPIVKLPHYRPARPAFSLEPLSRWSKKPIGSAASGPEFHAPTNSTASTARLDWQTPAERFDGTPFTDRGFASVPALATTLPDTILAA
jgi:hypothetical protein